VACETKSIIIWFYLTNQSFISIDFLFKKIGSFFVLGFETQICYIYHDPEKKWSYLSGLNLLDRMLQLNC